MMTLKICLLKTKLENKMPSDVSELVNYFLILKGWNDKSKEFYEDNNIVYKRYVNPSKQLLTLCESLEEAKRVLKKVSEWAESRNLGWSIWTAIKKWVEIDMLELKPKTPHFRDMKMVKKREKWYCIDEGGNWLEFVGDLNEVEYK